MIHFRDQLLPARLLSEILAGGNPPLNNERFKPGAAKTNEPDAIRIRIVDVESRTRHGERQAPLLFALALDVSI